jgi:DNA-binding PadR family transcriptional regulator
MSRNRVLSPQGKRVLEALLAAPAQWRHGYDLMGELGLQSGTLYPLLIRLHDRGILEAEWAEPQSNGRPPRQMYRLTSNGVAIAAQAVSQATPPLLPRLKNQQVHS